MGCLIRTQHWHVNMPRSKYYALNHRCEQTCIHCAGSDPAVRASANKGSLWRVGKQTRRGGKRYRCAFARIKWCSIYMTITARQNSEGQFSGSGPRKTTEDIVRFDGSQPLQWQWKFGGRNDTTIFDNIDISDLPMPIHLCSSRLRCCRFLMSDVYIGRTLALSNWVFIIQSVNWVLVLESWNIKWSAPSFKSQLVKGWCPVYFLVDVYCLFYSTKERGKWKLN